MAAGEGGDEEVRVLQTLRGKICESLGGVDYPDPVLCLCVYICTSPWPEREGEGSACEGGGRRRNGRAGRKYLCLVAASLTHPPQPSNPLLLPRVFSAGVCVCVGVD